MVAPDLETLYGVEAAVEPVAASLLTQNGIARVNLRRGTGALISGRVDAELLLGAARENSRYVPRNLPVGTLSTSACFDNSWNAVLVLNVITNRDTNAADHPLFLATIRVLLAQYTALFTEAALPYHAIANLRSAGTTPSLQSSRDEDVTQLRYSGVVSIRPGAWPAPY